MFLDENNQLRHCILVMFCCPIFITFARFYLGIHIDETVISLSKGYIYYDSVNIEVSLEDMDFSTYRGKATYKEIQNYVLEKFNLKVSTLNISQVKRKSGISMGTNYNKSKYENIKIPQCTPEKEKAILDALKHFSII